MKISIGFSTSSLWISRAIRWATRAPVSHTFLIIEDGNFGCPMIVQEAWRGFGLQTLESFKAGGDVVLAVIDPVVPLDAGLTAVAPLVGSSYGYAQLFGAAFVRLMRVLGKKVKNPLRSTRSLFCSELNAIVLQKSDYPGASALDPSDTSPEDLLEFLRSSASSSPARP